MSENMILNLGGSGGGASLNFKVVSNPRPENPTKNTIWVDTAEITSWIFSATEPKAPADGMVWILIDTTSPVEFNALKKNGIQICPISAKQYVGGVWVDKPSQIYQVGEWSSFWDGHYFKNGNQYESVTGGWTAQGYKNDNSAQVTIGETLTVSAPQSNNATVGTVNKIDLKEVFTLYAENLEAGAYKTYLVISETKDVSASGGYIERVALDAGVVSLDVATLNGEYYIAITGKGGSSGAAAAKVSAVWGIRASNTINTADLDAAYQEGVDGAYD